MPWLQKLVVNVEFECIAHKLIGCSLGGMKASCEIFSIMSQRCFYIPIKP
jgi:hypothetical protein